MLKTFSIALLLLSSCGDAQIHHQKMKTTVNNPLLCDPETGFCEIPSLAAQENNAPNVLANELKKPIRLTYFTDPICSSCWGIEPQLRKLKLEYGDYIQIEYRMGGLLPSWNGFNGGGISKPSDVAHHWDEVSQYYDMPIDGDLWLEDPLDSSYPPSIAFKAAQFQDEQKAVFLLRRLREMVFLQKKNIAKWENIEQAAREVGLDTIKLKIDFEGKAKQAFQDDLAYARKLGVHGFPTLIFSDESQNRLTIYGSKPYQNFESAVLGLFPEAQKKSIDTDFENVFNQCATLTTREFATLTDTTQAKALEILNYQYLQNRLIKIQIKNGILWKYKNE